MMIVRLQKGITPFYPKKEKKKKKKKKKERKRL